MVAVIETLDSDWLTSGPEVSKFEQAIAGVAGVPHAVAVSSGTAALHAALAAIGVGPGDEVIVPALTFAATANAVLYCGGTPVFADVEPDTLLLDPYAVNDRITSFTKAVIAVDYAGQPCDYDRLRAITRWKSIALVADACHAIGGSYRGSPVGALADLTCFSFHPVKHVAAGEGGAVVTQSGGLADRIRRFRNHGRDGLEMTALGYNYRLSDIHSALGRSQLQKLPASIARRREIVQWYNDAFCQLLLVQPLTIRGDRCSAHHLYVLNFDLPVPRQQILNALRCEGIGGQVHYRPVHLQPYYRKTFGTKEGLCPLAEAAAERIISLPLFPSMSDGDVQNVIDAVRKVCEAFA